jgi:hypothetical protein
MTHYRSLFEELLETDGAETQGHVSGQNYGTTPGESYGKPRTGEVRLDSNRQEKYRPQR